MADVFISFLSQNERLARFARNHLVASGVPACPASTSLLPGQKWSEEVLNALRSSNWVIFLASGSACASAWVQQELGAAIRIQKKLLPNIWDTPPTELPGWASRHQAINLAGSSIEQLRGQLAANAERIKSE
jgi:hypothetical protein